MANKTGVDIKISKTQIRKLIKTGGTLWSSLMPLATGALPTIGKTLGLSALSGLASEGVSQIIKAISGKGVKQAGGFLVKPKMLNQLTLLLICLHQVKNGFFIALSKIIYLFPSSQLELNRVKA